MPSEGSVKGGTPAREPGRSHISTALAGALSDAIPGEMAKSTEREGSGWDVKTHIKRDLHLFPFFKKNLKQIRQNVQI